ncbi:hypothetical protein niasHS_015835 [Heterodera schachtii]|uniref:Uncharacterized protein n=1 Tax=Heterodera schachtii TaxID=97005 RepID=A0ABD2I4K3_HETSC
MAIRLSAQIERNDHLNALLSASPNYHCLHNRGFFNYKIQITIGNLLEMNIPTWRMPYYVHWGNNKDEMVTLNDHERSEKALEEALVPPEAISKK